MKTGKPDYLAKVQKLSSEEQERLLSRMAGKLPRRLEKDKLSREEAMAIQMELEDEQLQEWRARMHAMNADAVKAGKTKAKAAEKPQEEKSEKQKAENVTKPKKSPATKKTKPAA